MSHKNEKSCLAGRKNRKIPLGRGGRWEKSAKNKLFFITVTAGKNLSGFLSEMVFERWKTGKIQLVAAKNLNNEKIFKSY